jgi:hypothetical protein
MDVAIWLTLTFIQCLVIVWCLEAYRKGMKLYGLAAIGVLVAVIGRLSRDAAPTTQVFVLQFAGLVLAGLITAFYLLTEVAEAPSQQGDPDGGAPA